MKGQNYYKCIINFLIVLTVSFYIFNTSAYARYGNIDHDDPSLNQAPKKIVILDPTLIDDVMMLGITPVGYSGEVPEYLKIQLKGAKRISQVNERVTWGVFYLDPDLIIVNRHYDKNFYRQLEKVAPTMILSGGDSGINKQIENLKILGITFKKEQASKKIISQFEKLLDDSEKLGQQYPATILILTVNNSKELMAMSLNTFASNLLRSFGKENLISEDDLSKKERHASSNWVQISIENITEKSPDQIVFLIDDSDKDTVKELMKNPQWQMLKAYRYHRIYFMHRDGWLETYGLEAMTHALTEANQTGFLSLKQDFE